MHIRHSVTTGAACQAVASVDALGRMAVLAVNCQIDRRCGGSGNDRRGRGIGYGTVVDARHMTAVTVKLGFPAFHVSCYLGGTGSHGEMAGCTGIAA